MANEIKFTDNEIGQLRDLQATYNNVVNNLGQTEIQLTEAEKNLDDLKETKLQLIQAYETAKQTESSLFTEINNKYAPGNLDIATGIFTPMEGALVDAEPIEVTEAVETEVVEAKPAAKPAK